MHSFSMLRICGPSAKPTTRKEVLLRFLMLPDNRQESLSTRKACSTKPGIYPGSKGMGEKGGSGACIYFRLKLRHTERKKKNLLPWVTAIRRGKGDPESQAFFIRDLLLTPLARGGDDAQDGCRKGCGETASPRKHVCVKDGERGRI